AMTAFPYPGPNINNSNARDPNNYYKYDIRWRTGVDANNPTRKVPLPYFICPSDQGHDVTWWPEIVEYPTQTYQPNAGSQGQNGLAGTACPGQDWARGNYACNAGG